MEHSATEYLKRKSTETLVFFLQQCLNEGLWQNYAHMIPEIFEILRRRDIRIPAPIVLAWESFLKTK